MFRNRFRIPALILASLALSACTTTRPEVPEIRPGFLAGYLAPAELPDTLAFLPPPPAEGSAALSADQEASRRALALAGTRRFEQAAADVSLLFPGAENKYACAIGTRVTEAEAPTLYRLLRRVLMDAGLSTYAAKNHYERPRPFMVNGLPTCSPDQEEELRHNGSYPSGHSALGWAWALVLSGLAPERSGEILKRGWEFGQSRVVCNVHWQSDVDAGRLAGAAAVARLHADATFRKDFEAAREELAALRASAPPMEDCPD